MKKDSLPVENAEVQPVGFLSKNPEFQKTLTLLERIVLNSGDFGAEAGSVPVLLLGPEGAGKAAIARWLGERAGRFVEVFCAAREAETDWERLAGQVRGGILFLNGVEALGKKEQAFWLNACETAEDSSRAFRVIASTSLDLQECVNAGTFRSDFAAFLSTWTFSIPGLALRTEDWPMLVEEQLEGWRKRFGAPLEFQEEAKRKYLRFAASSEAVWASGFRDLKASMTRLAIWASLNSMAITMEAVSAEIARLRALWAGKTPVVRMAESIAANVEGWGRKVLGTEPWDALDRFERVQLADVLEVCRQSQNFSEAGRILFSNSRLEKKTSNDTDRLRKYLLKFGITWNDIQNAINDTEK